MDPVGPWSAYASYNRLAGVQAGASTGDLHHHLTSSTTTGSPATTTTQILPGGFLSPPPVGYEVFSPLFHPTTKPAAHYVNQHRQALAQAQAAAASASASKQSSDGEYHQAQSFFDQGPTPWQQNSPFGILPHESVVATTKAGAYENFNAHFAAQSLNQLVATNSKNVRPRSPQVTTTTTKTSASQPNTSTFFQVWINFMPKYGNSSFLRLQLRSFFVRMKSFLLLCHGFANQTTYRTFEIIFHFTISRPFSSYIVLQLLFDGCKNYGIICNNQFLLKDIYSNFQPLFLEIL